MYQMKLFIILSLFTFILPQQCILGQNCPFNQGICAGDTCECLDGYKTLYNPKLPVEQQVYCNYKQIHHLIPLILEFFLAGFGHFYVGKYWYGIIKLALAVICFGSSYYLYKEFRKPSYIEALKETILNKILKLETIQGERSILYDIAQLCFNLTFHPFWIFWIFDLYMYFTKTYYDGYGFPLY